ncbi:MAG: hypothetical protein EHM39_05535 [Chloroflexi bacterium]|nr:MAG: hypothetical protein EHM39_05535 [Chloroflexota bacterium]
MTKAKTQIEAAPQLEERRTGVKGFVYHQSKMVEETGKALVSLLPREFRTHAGNAVKESRTSFAVLADGIVDTLEASLDKLRSKPKPEEPGKVKIEVE